MAALNISVCAQVFVLRRVSEGALNSTLSQQVRDHIFPVSSLPLASNIYSTWELCLLSWLNMHFQSMRKIVWGTGETHNSQTRRQEH